MTNSTPHPLTPLPQGEKGNAFILPILLILLLAFAVRVHMIGAQSLWHDEGNSYVQSTRTLAEIADNAARDIHPPGYYWLLHSWRLLVGESEFALRMFSTLASVTGIAFAYSLGKRLYGPLAAGTTAVFIALNTFSIFYAQETRMYALLALWSVASVWVLVGLLRATPQPNRERGAIRPVWMYALLLGLVNTAGLYTQYSFPFVMAAQGILVLLWLMGEILPFSSTSARGSKRNIRGGEGVWRLFAAFIAANLITLILYAPWLSTAWEQITTWPSTGESVTPGVALAEILANFGFGITVESGTTAAVAFFALFGLLVRPGAAETDESTRYEGWRMLVPVVWVAVSVGAFLALDLFRESNLKFLLPAQIAFALLLGRGVHILWTLKVRREGRLQQYVPKVAAVVGVFAVMVNLWAGLDPLYNDPAYQRDDYRAIAALIEAEAGPGDAVILSAPNQREVFDYYYTGDTPVFGLPPGLGADDTTTRDSVQTVIEDAERVYAVLWATAERDPNGVVESTLNESTFFAGSEWYGDVRLVQFATPEELTIITETGVAFGESITLREIALNRDAVTSGDALQIRLTWATDSPLETRYKVFVQLLAPDGTLSAQTDAEPGGLILTTAWSLDEAYSGNHALIIPADLPAETYTLIVGLYDANDPSVRLVVNPPGDGDFTAGDGYLIIGDVTVTQ